MKRYILFGAIMFMLSLPAYGAASCYQPAQLQAEQLLRLHSELMVITVTCRQGSNGEDLPAAYGDFTRKHIRVLHDAEQTMMDYYRASGRRDPTDSLDKLRTILGNEYGQKAADMTSPQFCAAYRDKVLRFDALSGADVENEAERMTISERSYSPSCHRGTTVAARKGG